MSRQQILALIVFIAFGFTTVLLTQNYNYITFFHPVLATGPSTQVLIDLCIAITLVLIWMYQDAKKTNRHFWVYLVITVLFGSFGPLLYFILRKEKA